MKKRKKIRSDIFKNDATKEEKRAAWDTLSRFGLIALLTFSFILFYYVADYMAWGWVFWTYFAALAACAVAYTVWNRGFTRSGVERENLPDTWSDEEKDKFIADGKRWREDSKVVLYIMIPLIFTFLVDTVKLFIVDKWF